MEASSSIARLEENFPISQSVQSLGFYTKQLESSSLISWFSSSSGRETIVETNISPMGKETMNDYEMMNQRVDQLRLQLDRIHDEESLLKLRKQDTMDELLDTRRQLTRIDLAQKP
jgi:hypothetical protein